MEKDSVPTLAKAAGRRQVILDATFSEMESIIPGEVNKVARLSKLNALIDELLGTGDDQWWFVDESIDDIIVKTRDGTISFTRPGKSTPPQYW